MSDITFGTDGWRAVIAEGYTFANLERVARATGQWLQAQGDKPSVVVGYDTRFLGAEFAAHTARVLASMGVRVQLADHFVTTPAVSWAVKEGGHTAGVVITASHNPPSYNGFKLKAHYGGPAEPSMIAGVEAELAKPSRTFRLRPLEDLEREGLVESLALRKAYVELLRKRIDVESIRGTAGLRVAYDAMYGAGQGILTELLGKANVVELHHEHNPGMNGRSPEPIERNLEELGRTVVERNLGAGLATDGDADRIGLYDEQGTFVDSHKILALLVKYLHKERRLRGSIVKTFSTTDMLDRMGKVYDLPVETTPIGFKYIAPKMVGGGVLVGGEESGGIAVRGHLPERDGLYIGLLVAEMIVKRERTLSGLVRELQDEFGPLHQSRTDLHTTEEKKQAFLAHLQSGGPTEIEGRPVEKVEDLDGYKFRVDGGWVMFRASGTEPVLRIYAEAKTRAEAEALVRDGVALVEG
ncbi:MAG TPA: phosphoglucomutase/phosphomannomutase family protein [Rhodothermales bacterium]|nr:phosphoglucomutase/phosphomannomutase family protein [Rhodothermales bacterium]